ncbi:MAG: ABC transporter substrate-binding protein [Proteobacteria bacterium]|nr:ABC transporter substrate-binding protein [Pseudomonadota bacterium]MBS0546477.1 ABC transporter substrate-binding protein [Pseudomonadota bacterium]
MVFSAVFAGLFAVSAHAATLSAADPSTPVRAVASEMQRISASVPPAERQAAVRQVLRQNFDAAWMARTALGAHWDSASAPQRERFVAALETSEAKAYTERLAMLGGMVLTVDRVTSRPDGSWTVDSSAGQNGGFPVKLAWEVRDGGQGPRIVDVRVGGVSLFATRQSEFKSVIRKSNGSIEPLVEAMEARAR